jgi:hypothetical protein
MLVRIINSIDAQLSDAEKELLFRLRKQCGLIIDGMHKLNNANLQSELSQSLEKNCHNLRTAINTALDGDITTIDVTSFYRQTLKLKNEARSLLDLNLLTLKAEFTLQYHKLSEIETTRTAIEEGELYIKQLLLEIDKISGNKISIKELREFASDTNSPFRKAATKLLTIIFEKNKLTTTTETKIKALESNFNYLESIINKIPSTQQNQNQYSDLKFELISLKSYLNAIENQLKLLLEQAMSKAYFKKLVEKKENNINKVIKQRDAQITEIINKSQDMLLLICTKLSKFDPDVGISAKHLVLPKTNAATGSPLSKMLIFFKRRKNQIHPQESSLKKKALNNFMNSSSSHKKKVR